MYSVHFNIWTNGVRYVGLHLLFILLAGFSGTILSYLGMKQITRRFPMLWLADLGAYTFPIYMIQEVLFKAVFAAFHIDLKHQAIYFLVSIVITYILWKFVAQIARSQKLSAVFLGKSKS